MPRTPGENWGESPVVRALPRRIKRLSLNGLTQIDASLREDLQRSLKALSLDGLS